MYVVSYVVFKTIVSFHLFMFYKILYRELSMVDVLNNNIILRVSLCYSYLNLDFMLLVLCLFVCLFVTTRVT